jgi:hypothetical protein
MHISMHKSTLCVALLLHAGAVGAYLSSPKFPLPGRLHLSSAKSQLSLRQPSFVTGRRTSANAVRMAVAQGGMDQIIGLNMPGAAKKSWEVHKFGGASLADAGLYRTVGDLLIAESKGRGDGAVPTMAIVSAMSGTTDQLIGVVNAALKDPAEAKKLLDVAVDKQINTLKELAGPEIVGPIERNIRKDADDIMGVLQALKLLRTIPAVTLELITGFGEVAPPFSMHRYIRRRWRQKSTQSRTWTERVGRRGSGWRSCEWKDFVRSPASLDADSWEQNCRPSIEIERTGK